MMIKIMLIFLFCNLPLFIHNVLACSLNTNKETTDSTTHFNDAFSHAINIFFGKGDMAFSYKNNDSITHTNNCNLQLQVTHIDCNNIRGTIQALCNDNNITYQLNNGNPQSSNIFTGLEAGHYTIRAIDSNNIVHIVHVTILDNSMPIDSNWNFEVDIEHIFCPNTLGNIIVHSNRSDILYSIDGNTWQSNNQFTGLSQGTYTIMLKTLDGCNTKYEHINIKDISNLSTTIELINIDCNHSTGTIKVNLQEPNFTFYLNNTLPQNQPVFENLVAGNYRLFICNGNCTREFNLQILDNNYSSTITPLPIPILCNNQTTTLGLQETFATYIWSTGQTTATINSRPNTNNYALTVTDNNGCIYTQNYNLNIIRNATIPVFNLSNNDCIQANNYLALNDEFTSYQWSTGDTTASILASTNINNYTVTVSDNNGCIYTKEIQLKVSNNWNFQALVSPFKCAEDLAIITLNSSNRNLSYALNSGVWKTHNVFEDLSTGVYIIAAKDNNGCIVEKEINILLPEKLELNAEAFSNTCQGRFDGKITAIAKGGTLTNLNNYLYSLNGYDWSELSDFYSLRPQDYMLYVKDDNNCRDTLKVTIPNAPPFYILSATQNITIDYGTTIELSINLNDNTNLASQYWFSTQNHQRDHNIVSIDTNAIQVAPTKSTVYKYSVTNNLGCKIDTFINVIVNAPRHANAPKAFTPNGDLTNDKFFIQGNESMIQKVKKFRVYDRWGMLVFERDNIPVNNNAYGWDGTWDGTLLQAGVFAWYAEVEFIDGEVEILRGDVTLIK